MKLNTSHARRCLFTSMRFNFIVTELEGFPLKFLNFFENLYNFNKT